MSGFQQLSAAVKQTATIQQLVYINAIVDQKGTNVLFHQLTAAVKQKVTIEQLEHISAIVE